MKKANIQKLKLLKMYDILRTESDEDNPICTNTLIKRMADEGIEVERKTLYDDIKTLNAGGYEVLCRRERANKYYVVDRQFDVAELKILIDAVHSAKFITTRKTKQVVDKISALAGKNRAKLLKRDVTVVGCAKQSNEHIFYSVDTIDEALNKGKKISFRYYDLDCDMNKVLRNDGKVYKVNPVTLAINNDYYYLICYKDKYKNLASYRVDKMIDVTIEDEQITPAECVKNFNINLYKKATFNMFSGDIQTVEIMAQKELVNVIIDKFGSEIKITPVSDSHVIVEVNVQISPQFFGWCFGLENKIRILSPDCAISKYKEHLSAVCEAY